MALTKAWSLNIKRLLQAYWFTCYCTNPIIFLLLHRNPIIVTHKQSHTHRVLAMANKDWSKVTLTEDMKDYLYETYKDSWKPGDEVSDEMLDTLWNYAMVEG